MNEVILRKCLKGIFVFLSFLNVYLPLSGGESVLQLSAVFPKTPEECFTVLKDKNADSVTRRHAFRNLIYEEVTFRKALQLGLKDPDRGIRALALYELFQKDGKKALPLFYKMAEDPSAEVRNMIMLIARSMWDQERNGELLRFMQKKNMKTAAASRIFLYHKVNQPISQSPTYDHRIEVLRSIDLTQDPWTFRTDFRQSGHVQKWFNADFDDSKWKRIRIGQFWEGQGYSGYDGIAWYRVKFRMPPKIKSLAVELSFKGVDESAWVWLNGHYIGQHDMGPEGWKIPFKLDVTSEVKWNGENVLVVRVRDTEQAGGIYKDVHVEILK